MDVGNQLLREGSVGGVGVGLGELKDSGSGGWGLGRAGGSEWRMWKGRRCGVGGWGRLR